MWRRETLTCSHLAKTDRIIHLRIVNLQNKFSLSACGTQSLWNINSIWSTIGEKHWIPLRLCAQITQHGCKNTEQSQRETFFWDKAYLATFLHIRPPQSLSEFQQRKHHQKTQKHAVRYHCCSHGNSPTEGVPAPTLICSNSMWHTTHTSQAEGALCTPGPPPRPPWTKASSRTAISESD